MRARRDRGPGAAQGGGGGAAAAPALRSSGARARAACGALPAPPLCISGICRQARSFATRAEGCSSMAARVWRASAPAPGVSPGARNPGLAPLPARAERPGASTGPLAHRPPA